MADSSSVPTWAQLLVSSGVLGLVGAAATRAWKWFVERPLRKAELRAEAAELREQEARRRCDMLAGELKATATAFRSVRRLDELQSGAPLSTPPPRDEMPTLEHIIESRADRAWAEQRERERSRPLNAPEPRALPLEALGGKSRLPPRAGRADYDAHAADRMSRGYDTPTQAFRPKQPTHRDEDTPPDGIAAKPPRPGKI